MLGDIAGFARRLEEGQSELNSRLDRIIALLEMLAERNDSPGAQLRSLRPSQSRADAS
jgi:hypothetical protein